MADRVGIGIPSTDMWHASFGVCLAEMMAFNSRAGLVQGLANMRSYDPVMSRNEIVKACFETGLDWVLFLDSDMVFPRDTLIRLLSHNKPMVGASYVRRLSPNHLLGYDINKNEIMDGNGLIPMARMPTGCLLIHKSVFEPIPYPWFQSMAMVTSDGKAVESADGFLNVATEDYVFSDKVTFSSQEMWCDLDLTKEIGHIKQEALMWKPTVMVEEKAA